MINDVTALRADPDLAAVCAETGCELVLMHMQGTPRTMQENPTYDDVVDDVHAFLAERIEFAVSRDRRDAHLDRSGNRLRQDRRAQPRAAPAARRARASWGGRSRSAPRARASSARSPERGGRAGRRDDRLERDRLRERCRMLRVHDVEPMREALAVAEAILSDRGDFSAAD